MLETAAETVWAVDAPAEDAPPPATTAAPALANVTIAAPAVLSATTTVLSITPS